MLHLASLWRARGGPPVRAIHINHGLETAADDWAEVCQTVCDRLAINLDIHRVIVALDEGRGLEASARSARYAVFRQVLGADEVLLLAHHANDQAETVLQRLLRGTGPRGLAGMPRRRVLGRGALSRPLLGITQEGIRDWASRQSLKFVIDPSNENPRFDRGYLRTEILPGLEARWPRFATAVTRCTDLQAGLLDRLGGQALPLNENALGERTLAVTDSNSPAELAGLIHHWVSEEGLQAPAAVRLTEFSRQCLEAAEDRLPELVVPPWALRYWRGKVALARADLSQFKLPGGVTAGLPEQGEWGCLNWIKVTDSPGIPAGETLTLRYRLRGENLTPLGARSRDYGKLCQEYGIPPWWRGRLPVLICGDTPVFAPVIGPLAGLAAQSAGAGDTLLPLWRPIDFEPFN